LLSLNIQDSKTKDVTHAQNLGQETSKKGRNHFVFWRSTCNKKSIVARFAPMTKNSMKFSSIPSDEILSKYQVKSFGLTLDQVEKQRLIHGLNELDLEPKEGIISKFIEQFQNPLILLLLASALVSLVMGQVSDAISIALTILIVSLGMVL
jgi:magnesium-transporting ATPase (P-type)